MPSCGLRAHLAGFFDQAADADSAFSFSTTAGIPSIAFGHCQPDCPFTAGSRMSARGTGQRRFFQASAPPIPTSEAHLRQKFVD
jgi:hypothetical protein